MTTGSSSEGRAGRTWRERITVAGPAMVIMIAGLVIAYQFIQPAPPRHIVLATGPEQGTYAYYGRLYRDRLQRDGITVTTKSTRGSIENIELLRDHRADIAFVQGGAAEDIEAPHL